MKTKILKLVLCAFAALPLGAWAEEINFGTEVSVSSTTLWLFNDWTGSSISVGAVNDISGTASAYLRSGYDLTSVSEIPNFVSIDGSESRAISKAIKRTGTIGNASAINATYTAGKSIGESGSPNNLFAFNASVAGTVYVYAKSGGTNVRIYNTDGDNVATFNRTVTADAAEVIAYSSSKKSSFFIGSTTSSDQFYIYAVYFVPATEEKRVSSETTWVFDGMAGPYTQNAYAGDNGYIHATASYQMTVTASSGNKDFTDGHNANWTKYLASSNAMQNRNDTYAWATGASENTFTPSFGFYAAVPGTCYALMSSNTASKKLRIHYANGSSVATTELTATTADEIYEVKREITSAGAVFVGGVEAEFKIYAVRFVPLTDEITIGATGYATYSNNNSCALSLPDGLTAYSAAAGGDGHSVTLTAVSQMRPTSGYVVKGTPDNSYTLTAVVDQKKPADSPGSMKRAAVYGSNVVPATDNGNYNYLLGNDSGIAKFFAPNGTSVLGAKKAFLQVSSELTSEGRGLDIIIEDGTTGIMQITRSKYGAEEYFNLSGQRVVNPTKGLYIVNGKKVIIK